MSKIPDGVTPIPMKLKFRLRNIFRRAFTTFFDDMVEEYAKVSVKHRHLAWYWEQVARGEIEMPDKNDDVQLIADNMFISMLIQKNAEMMLHSPENNFRVNWGLFEK